MAAAFNTSRAHSHNAIPHVCIRIYLQKLILPRFCRVFLTPFEDDFVGLLRMLSNKIITKKQTPTSVRKWTPLTSSWIFTIFFYKSCIIKYRCLFFHFSSRSLANLRSMRISRLRSEITRHSLPRSSSKYNTAASSVAVSIANITVNILYRSPFLAAQALCAQSPAA